MHMSFRQDSTSSDIDILTSSDSLISSDLMANLETSLINLNNFSEALISEMRWKSLLGDRKLAHHSPPVLL
jgi:hypothetical protein